MPGTTDRGNLRHETDIEATPAVGGDVTRPIVTVTRRLPRSVEEELSALFDARLNESDRPLSSGALQLAARESDAILCTVTDRINAEVLAAPLRTRIIANYGVGYNHIDLAAARDGGIVVTNTPGVLTDATADCAMMLILMVARRAGEGERELRAGRWSGWRPTHLVGRSVTGRTLGIVGMGRIGRALARRAHGGFGMRIVYHSRTPLAPAESASLGAEARSLDALLSESDFISLHVPATPETRHLIDRRTLALIRPHACLINTARGDVVDEAALIEALESGMLGGAALDVYEREPAVPAALIAREDVVLLPHLGSATEEARVAMGRRAVANLAAYFRGEPLPDPVS